MKAKDLKPGDVIRLQFSGGTEDVEMDQIVTTGEDNLYWYGWNPVTGDINGTLKPDEEVRVIG